MAKTKPSYTTDDATAYELFEVLRKIIKTRNSSALAIGELLYYLKEKDRYKKVAEGASWSAFLADPEINLHKTSAWRYMRIFSKYIRDLEMFADDLEGLDLIMLDQLVPYVTKKNVDEWLSRIATLSRSDITKLIKQELHEGKIQRNDVESE